MKKAEKITPEQRKILTDTYEKALTELYTGYIRLTEGTEWLGRTEKIPHLCTICNNVTDAKPTTMLGVQRQTEKELIAQNKIYNVDEARGCGVCRTTATNARQVSEYVSNLYSTHRGRYVLSYIPPRFNPKSPHVLAFKCNRCGKQSLRTAAEMLDRNFKCTSCEEHKPTAYSLYYQRRIEVLYESMITLKGAFKMTGVMKHVCSVGPHVFRASMVDMLNGHGCTHCKIKTEVYSTDFAYRNRVLKVRSDIEKHALKYLLIKRKTLVGIKTSLEFPIPILRKYSVPALFDVKTKTVFEVVAKESLQKACDRITRSFIRAPKLDVSYVLLMVDEKGTATQIDNVIDWKELKKKRGWK